MPTGCDNCFSPVMGKRKEQTYALAVHEVVSTERPKRMGLLPCESYRMVQVGDSIVFQATDTGEVEWKD